MKKICILFLVFSLTALTGCGLIVKEDQDIRTIGVREPEAKETLAFVDKKADDEKMKIWPWGKISEYEE
ncbi:MAG: hypothetical protein P9M07_06760 [Candidatus Aceula meridiana]|nr:hypothetical protein [Candidatus Aceula meridiana]